MKKFLAIGVTLALIIGIAAGWESVSKVGAKIIEIFYGDPDLGPFETSMTREEFMAGRSEYIASLRGVEKDKPFDPQDRLRAVKALEKQEVERINMMRSPEKTSILATWSEIGPNPIPNGQVVTGPQLAVSGRVVAIAIHPTNPDIVYVGTAQGGLYRTTTGGVSWTPMMDGALSLAVNTIAIAPSQPDTIFVGTGEASFSSDSFFGVGIYRFDNASSSSPTMVGPLNKDASNGDVFTGRSIGDIVVHPTNPNIIFTGSTSGVGGLTGAAAVNAPDRGLFRSINAMSANPTFAQLTVAGLPAQNRNVLDMVMDPGNPNLLLLTVGDSFNETIGGVYRTTDALAAAPTFARTFTAGSGTSQSRTELALNRTGSIVTIYAASAFNGGTVQRSTDGGATWTQQIDNNFCGGQCFYNIAFDVDPIDASKIYLGGTGTNTTFAFSTNGGTSFTNSQSGLHTDSHAIAVAPSQPSTVYFGSDGGIYKSTDSGLTWTSLNNSTFRATQFMGISVHPIDPNFTIGGTQDNGTNFYKPDGTWTRADFGDGGFSVIDQSAVNTTVVNMYHTYFNDANTLQGYAFSTNGLTPTEGTWFRRGCSSSGTTVNGITCNGVIRFYAPLEQGPGTPNTIYYGSDRLYRSADTGLTHTVVSQNPIVSSVAITAIGVAPQNDNIRVAGLLNGALWGTTTGSSTLTDLDPNNTIPNNSIARIVIDPTNAATAYVTLSAFSVVNIWKTTNLSAASPVWTSAALGIPQVPVNAFLVDPVNSNILYAGTDIGVYVSTDSGSSWTPFGTGLPRVAVFDMAKSSGNLIRIATHGRGMWQIPAIDAVVPTFTVSGRVLTASGLGLRNAIVTMTNSTGEKRIATTSSFGLYSFQNVASSQTYFLGVSSKRYRFATKTFEVSGNLSNVDFTGLE